MKMNKGVVSCLMPWEYLFSVAALKIDLWDPCFNHRLLCCELQHWALLSGKHVRPSCGRLQVRIPAGSYMYQRPS